MAFEAFDDDEDEVLTLDEITEGLDVNNIDLQDSEKEKLLKMIDSNNDGVCTLDEWINILEPAIKAENKFIDIMGGLDIKNPLILEEQILDLTFKSRRLNL